VAKFSPSDAAEESKPTLGDTSRCASLLGRQPPQDLKEAFIRKNINR